MARARVRNIPLAIALAIAALFVTFWQRSDAPPPPAASEAAPAGTRATPPSTAAPAPAESSAAQPEERSPLDSLDAVERREVEETVARIERGGPFPYAKDGTVFSNRERRLPLQPRGYYREYTVETPGASNRGARRIVRGAGGETYYTRDHYETFVRIDDSR